MSVVARKSSFGSLRFAAMLIALGALCLGVKATAIVLTGDQPPVLFEVAGLPLGLGLLLLGRSTMARRDGIGRRMVAALTLAWIAILAATIGTLFELFSIEIVEPLESILAVSSGFGPLLAALLIGLQLRVQTGSTRRIGRRALLIPIMFMPLIILGGIAGDLAGERYFELGLLAVAALWLSLAHAIWAAAQHQDRSG